MAGGNILWRGYRTTIANVLTTELNSLADGNVSALSSEFDNTTNLDMFADLQLDLASLTISSTVAFVTLFVVPTIDGTNYPDFSSGAIANYHLQYARATALVKNVSAATARVNFEEVRIGPGKFKFALRNGTGAALASSGNTLGWRDYAGSYT
jgi:hypothetical protein